jgi:hypothetical protein
MVPFGPQGACLNIKKFLFELNLYIVYRIKVDLINCWCTLT